MGVSNRVVFDPLITRYLAAELDERMRGRGCAAAPFFAPDLSVTLPLDRGEELRADLHPDRGWITIPPHGEDLDPDELDAICTGVTAPPDERLIRIDLLLTGRFQEQRRAILLELATNQWNAIVVDEDHRILNVLRGRRAGSRSIFPGASYSPPPGEARYGATGSVDRAASLAHWLATVEAAPDGKERQRRLIRELAWTGSAVSTWILAAETAEARFERWWSLRSLPSATPGIVAFADGPLPYPVRLEGLEFTPAPSLLLAMAGFAEVPAAVREERDDGAAARAYLDRRAAATQRKVESLRDELSRAGEGAKLRGLGDLLLGKMHEVPRGASRAVLTDWEDAEVEIALDPALTPAENAARYYDEARRRERAEERLPELIARAERELSGIREATAAVGRGTIPDWVQEELRRRVERTEAAGGDDSPTLPYRVFRTSGGLEVRVGRGARENDRLTFRESSPNDVWLHARSVPGSHVILRWADPDGAPPARDLAEAATIAAVFSRARTSGTVAVDWTRRKHVRKPRGAAPGLVIPQRVKTLFVEPDEAAVERLATIPGG